jgi:hypothetical protein
LGDLKTIENKIRAWGHKEYNNYIVLKLLKYNVSHGYDIFRRKNFGRLTYIEPNDKLLTKIFVSPDDKYNSLIGPRFKKEVWINKILISFFFKIYLKFSRTVNGI